VVGAIGEIMARRGTSNGFPSHVTSPHRGVIHQEPHLATAETHRNTTHNWKVAVHSYNPDSSNTGLDLDVSRHQHCFIPGAASRRHDLQASTGL